jgi:predicted DNA-binding antitoxin AbrB/MazE fold protein
MTQLLEAIYEHGAFKPVDPEKVHLREGSRVTLRVDEQELREPLRLAMQVYEGLSAAEIDEVEHIALDRSWFFESRPLEP